MPPFIASVQCQIGAEGRCRTQCAAFIWLLCFGVYLHLQHEYAAVNVSVSASASSSQTRSHVCVWSSGPKTQSQSQPLDSTGFHFGLEKPHIGIAPLPFLVAKTDCIIMKVKCIAQMATAMAMSVTRCNTARRCK